MTLCIHPRIPRPAALAVLLLAAACGASAQISLTTIVEMAEKQSTSVRLAQSDLEKAAAQSLQIRDAFIPSASFGSGLPAFREIGFTGSLPTIWNANVQSLVFSMQQIRYIQAARKGIAAAQHNVKDAREQVALDTSLAYIELDAVNNELSAARQQESYAQRLVEIEQQRTDAGVDPLSQLLQARLIAAQLKLSHIHLESRSESLAKQISTLTGLPSASILTDHASIPEIPAISGETAALSTAAVDAARAVAESKQLIAKGDSERPWTPQVAFGITYNRNTTLLNSVSQYFVGGKLPANNLSSGFSITVPLFDAGLRDKARESAADALRARIEADQAQRQYDQQLSSLNSNLRELDAQAEIATLKRQIADDQLKTVLAQLEVGNGAGVGPGVPAQLSPTAEQNARIDERQKYQDAMEATLSLSRARLSLVRALGHMQDWLDELHAK